MNTHFRFSGRAARNRVAVIAAVLLLGAACSVGVKSGPADGGVYKSTDGGDTWKQVVFVGQGKAAPVTLANLSVSRLLFSPVEASTLYAVAPDGVWQTQNAGDQWQRVYQGSIQGFAPSPAVPDTLYLASGNRILNSGNGGKTWQPVYIDSTPGASFTDLAVDAKTPRRLYATTNRGSLLRSGDGGSTWQLLHSFSEPVLRLVVQPQNPQLMYAPHANGSLERSSDGGEHWEGVTPDLPNVRRFSAGLFQAIALPAQRTQGLYYATKYGLWRSADAGSSWESLALVTPPNTASLGAVVIDARNELRITYTADSVLYRSQDGGRTWKATPLPSSRRGTALVASPADGNVLYLGLSPAPKKR